MLIVSTNGRSHVGRSDFSTHVFRLRLCSVRHWATAEVRVSSSLHVSARRMCDFYNSHSVESLGSYRYRASVKCTVFQCSSVSLYLSPLSTRLACCVARLWPEAGLEHNHVDREATRRHCHPLCPLPVAAAELLLTSPHSSVSTLSVTAATHLHFSGAFWKEARQGKKKSAGL